MNPQPMTETLPLSLADMVDRKSTIDRQYLARFTLGNIALEREVLGLFAGQAPLYLQRLLDAQTSHAWVEAAHTLKGASAGLGIKHVARLAAAAEGLDVFAVADPTQRAAARADVVAALRVAVDQAVAVIRDLEAEPA